MSPAGVHKCVSDVLVVIMQQSPLGRLLLDGVAPENLPAEQTRLQIVANMIHHGLAQKISALDGGEDARSALLGFHALKLMKASVLPRLVGVLCCAFRDVLDADAHQAAIVLSNSLQHCVSLMITSASIQALVLCGLHACPIVHSQLCF